MEVNYEGNNYSFPDDVSDVEVLEFFQGQSVTDSAVVTRAHPNKQTPYSEPIPLAPEPAKRTDYNSYLDQLSIVESGGKADAKAKTSSATGEFQFIDSTWLDMMKRKGPEEVANMSDEEILDMRYDPQMSRRMAEEFSIENAEYLAKKGLPTDNASLYLAHFLGRGTAAKILAADSNSDISDFVGMSARMANRGVFKNVDTTQDLRDWAARKMGVEVPERGTVVEPIGDPTVPSDVGIENNRNQKLENVASGLNPFQGDKTEADYRPEVVDVLKETAVNVLKKGRKAFDYEDYPKGESGISNRGAVASSEERSKKTLGEKLDVAFTGKDKVLDAIYSIGGGTIRQDSEGNLYAVDKYDFTPIGWDKVKDSYGLLRFVMGGLSELGLLNKFTSKIKLGNKYELLGEDADKYLKDANVLDINDPIGED
jgi:hypothetical protein